MQRKAVTWLVAASAAMVPAAAPADGVLDKLQDEVAAIASHARAAVVSIEDARLAQQTSSNAATDGAAAGMRVGLEIARQFGGDVFHRDAGGAQPGGSRNTGTLTSPVAPPTPGNAGSIDIDAEVRHGMEEARVDVAKEKIKLLAQREDLHRQRRDAVRSGNTAKAAQLDAAIKGINAAISALQTINRSVLTGLTRQLSNIPQMIFPWTPKSGTGFSIGDGYVVTTADVLDGMQNPTVVTGDGLRMRAAVVGVDSVLNVGLLRVSAGATRAFLAVGDSGHMRVGNFAVSVGNQAGEADSVSLLLVGNIKTAGTTAGSRYYPSLFEISGTIGAGSSGAPLINTHGEVVGIVVGSVGSDYNSVFWNRDRAPAAPQALPRQHGQLLPAPADPEDSAIAPPQAPSAGPAPRAGAAPGHVPESLGDSADVQVVAPARGATQGEAESPVPGTVGMAGDDRPPSLGVLRPSVTSAGYAIPISLVERDLQRWRSGAQVRRGFLGVQLRTVTVMVTDQGAERVESSPAVEVTMPGLAADRAGIVAGDVIDKIDQTPVHTVDDIRTVLLPHEPGDLVTVEVRRNGQHRKVTVTLGSAPDSHSK